MSSDGQTDATQSLAAHARGDPNAAAELLPLVYSNLRALAATYMRQERPDHTLQPTALVHEAYLRLIDISRIDWEGKSHFFAMAARQMRRVLIEHARRVDARKRGGGLRKLVLEDKLAITPGRMIDALALEEALQKLARRNRRHGRVAELRLYAGMSGKETAFVLGVSERTVRQEWRYVRAWLARELSPGRRGRA